MGHVAPIYPAFAKGEVSPLMFGRIDIDQYNSCLKKCRNCYIRPYGIASRVSGTEFVSNAKNNGKARLLKFIFSAKDSYIIECGAGYFRFYQNGGAILAENANHWEKNKNYKKGDFVNYNDGIIYYCIKDHTSLDFNDDFSLGYWVVQNIYEVPNDYTEEQLDSIQYVQLDDIIKLTCLPVGDDYATSKPKELRRKGNANWEFKNVDFKETPYLEQNITNITLTASAVTGDNITITASADFFNEKHVGAFFWIGLKVKDSETNEDIQGYIKVTGYTSATKVTAKVMAKLSGTTATKIWGEGAFSDYRGYPSVVALYDGRLYYARTPHQPRNIYGSKPYAYETFTPSVDNEDDGAINIELATNANGDGSDIKWLIGASSLLCGTYGGEFIIRGTGDGAITPTDVSARQRTNWGGEAVQPLVAGSFVHFIQRNGKKLRQFQYDYYYDSYKAVDVSIFSEHLLESPIKEMALQKNPDSIIYLMRKDGKVVMLTLEQDQSVQAWSLLEELGASVESIQTIPSYEGNYDEVYMLMLRQGLRTTLTASASSPDITIINNYTGTLKEVGTIYKMFTAEYSKSNVISNGNVIVNNGIASNFSSKNYLTLPINFTPASNAWEIVFSITTGEDVTTKQFLCTSSQIGVGTEFILQNTHLSMSLSNNGKDYIVSTEKATGSYVFEPNTHYFIKMKFTGSVYTLEYSLNGYTWFVDVTVNSTKKVTNNKNFHIGVDWYDKFQTPFLGSIDLNDCYIKINDVYEWQGTTKKWVSDKDPNETIGDFNVGVSGKVRINDQISMTINTEEEAPVRYIERIKAPLTSNIREDWWYVRSGLGYNAYDKTKNCNIALSDTTGNITIEANSSIFEESNVGKVLRAVDSNMNIVGEALITQYIDSFEVKAIVQTSFNNTSIIGGNWGFPITKVYNLIHLENREVQVFADGHEEASKIVSFGSIELDKPAYKLVVGLPYQSYITTMPLEAGSQNGTAVGKRKRIGDIAIRVWNTLGCKVGRDLNNLYDTIYNQKEVYTGVIPNIKYNQGWTWDADITIEQSKPYPMNILAVAPIVTEVDK